MDNHIDGLRGHVIICGYGRVGRAAAEQLIATGNDVVVIDRDPDSADRHHHPAPGRRGDRQRHPARRRDRAGPGPGGVARQRRRDRLPDPVRRALAPDLVIVARARTADSKEKLVLAGASRAVNPQMIGGRRLAAFALQPDVAEFLDVSCTTTSWTSASSRWWSERARRSSGAPSADLDIPEAHRRPAPRAAAGAPCRLHVQPTAGTLRSHAGCVLIAFGTSRASRRSSGWRPAERPEPRVSVAAW